MLLKDCATIKGGKRLPKGQTLQNVANDHPYIRVKDMQGRYVVLDSSYEYVPDSVFPSISRYTVETNDIILSIVGTVGLVALVEESLNNASLTENCVKLINIKNHLPEFIYYYLYSDKGQAQISEGVVGSTQPKFPLYNIEKLDVPDISMNEQQHIVDILGSIDAKIENNELLAKKILHFYMAQYHELLAKATQTVHLDEIATIESGKRPPIKMNVASGGCETPIIGASTIMGFTNTYLYDEPILIIGRVGTHGIVQISKGKSFPSDNTLIIKSEYYTFCYCLLNEIDYNALNKGSTQPLITQTDIKKLFVLLPDDKDLIKFESNNKLDYIISLQEENKKLQELKVLYLKKFFE